MTILDASNLLHEFFITNNSFCLEDDFQKLVTISDEPERHKAAIVSALYEFEEKKLVTICSIEDKKYYILNKYLY